MPQSATTRLALYRPLSDGSELVNVQQDINNNWAKIDAAVGAAAVTSTTRPSVPYTGQLIRETDTSRIYVSNGSAPASGSWSEITTPGTAQTFTAGVSLTGTSALVTRASAASNAYRAQVTGDTNSRFIANADGQLIWGTGATAGDTNLYRGAANQLKTDDDLVIVGNVTAANLSLGAATAYTPAWGGTGVSIGNGAVKGSYFLNGKMCTAMVEVMMGTTSAFGSGVWTVTLPFTAASGPSGASVNWAYCGSVRGHGPAWYAGTAAVTAGASTMRFYSHTNASEWKSDTPWSWTAAATSYFHAEVTFETV
jgi:hypothetical protein